MAEKLYAEQAEGGEQPETEAAGPDDAVDAEFEEVKEDK